MNGSQEERHLMATLRGHAFIPMRAPGSGTGDWSMPDVLAAQQGITVAVELKSGKRPSNVQEQEVRALERFADAFWAAAVIAVRYSGDRTFYLVDPKAMQRTPSGHYSIPGDPSTLPWSLGLPFERRDGSIQPKVEDNGAPRILYATEEVAPGLPDWLDALTAAQQGFQVRRGVLDLQDRDDDDSGAQAGESDA